MKKIIAVLIGALLLASPEMGARQFNDGPRNDLNVSYGYFTIPQFATVLGGVFGAAFSMGYAEPEEILSTGSVQLEYLHRSNNWLWLGVGVSGEKDTLVMSTKDSDGNVTGKSNTDLNTLTVFGTAKANWLRRRRMAMYTRLSVGAFTTFQEGSDIAPTFQLSLLGLEAGGQSFRGYIELGAGMHGVICGGFRYLF